MSQLTIRGLFKFGWNWNHLDKFYEVTISPENGSASVIFTLQELENGYRIVKMELRWPDDGHRSVRWQLR